MDRRRALIGLQLIAGLIFAGFGHYFVSSFRHVYPIDGFVFYAIALILFARVRRAVTQEAHPAWAVVRNSIQVAWEVLRDALRVLWTALQGLIIFMPTRASVWVTIGLNVLAAVLAWLWPSAAGLWVILWTASIAIWIVPPLLRSAGHTRLVKDAEETAGPGPSRIGCAVALALLSLGQLAVGSTANPEGSSGSSSVGDLLNESLRLDLVGDPGTVLAGGVALAVGTIAFAVVTRRAGLLDRPRLTLDTPASAGERLGSRWLTAAVLGMAIWLVTLQSIADGATGWGGVLPWLLSLGLIGACWWKVDRARQVRHTIAFDRTEALALGLAALVMLTVFSLRLDTLPSSMWGDEGAFFTLARDIAAGRFTPDFFGLGTYTYPMAGSIYQSIWIGLFGANIPAWRLGSVSAALLAIVPIFFLVRATLGRRVAWLSLALYATSPYLLTYSRMGYNNAQSIAPVAVTLALTWLAIRRDSQLFAFAAGCAGGLGFYTYPAAQVGSVLALGWLGWTAINRRAPARSIVRQVAAYALGMLWVAAPVVVYGITRQSELFAQKHFEAFLGNVGYARHYFPEEQLFSMSGPFQVGTQQWFYQPGTYLALLARGLIRTALSFHAPWLVNEHYLVGALAGPIGIFYLLGLGWCLVRLRQPGYAIWPAWLLFGALVLSTINTFPPRAAHMLPVVPALTVLGALGLALGIDVLAALAGGISGRAKSIGLIGSVIVLGFLGLYTYYVEMPARFPPDLENAMFWQAQQMPRGSDITLIQPDDLPDDFQPWGLSEFDLGVAFHLLKPGRLDMTNLRGLCSGECRFFFKASARDAALPRLTQVFGNGSLVAYPDAGGVVQAYMFAPAVP